MHVLASRLRLRLRASALAARAALRRRTAPGAAPGRCTTPRTAATSSGVPGDDDLAAAGAALRAEVDDPVGRLDHVEVVLDDEHRVAGVDEVVQHLEQLAGCRRSAARSSARRAGTASCRCCVWHQLAGQLDPLGLAAGERRRRLAELDVVEADVVQRLQHVRGSCGMFSKCSSASCTSISSTSAMLLPLKRTCSVSRLKRWPSQTGHVTHTSARKSISSRFEPLPSHASQRPPRR